MSERHAVWMLYGFAASRVLALLVKRMKLDRKSGGHRGFTILLTLLGVYLAGVKVYDQTEGMSLKINLHLPSVAFPNKRRIFEVLLDVVLIILCTGVPMPSSLAPFPKPRLETLSSNPAGLVFVKMATFLVWAFTAVAALHQHRRSNRLC